MSQQRTDDDQNDQTQSFYRNDSKKDAQSFMNSLYSFWYGRSSVADTVREVLPWTRIFIHGDHRRLRRMYFSAVECDAASCSAGLVEMQSRREP